MNTVPICKRERGKCAWENSRTEPEQSLTAFLDGKDN